MNYTLPRSLIIGGKDRPIRSDYRAALDILAAQSDPELADTDKTLIALKILYPDFEEIPRRDYQEAIDQCFWFLNAGEDENRGGKGPRLMDWEQDFPLICAPVNRILGKDVRGMEYLHWWTFLSAYMEIGGECTFAQVVSIRDKRARGKKLDQAEREWYRRNRNLVEFKRRYTAGEDEAMKDWV